MIRLLLALVLLCLIAAPLMAQLPANVARQKYASSTNPALRSYDAKALQGADQAVAVLQTNYGTIKLRFFPQDAPNHVANFLFLAREGFYDGTLFHRVISGFMIQGGCPKGTGTGNPGWRLKAEFNSRPHKRGIVSMARSQSPDSAGSQFFIVHKDSNFLDRQYTVFGEVTEGMDVVDKIAASPTSKPGDRPQKDVVLEKVTIQ